MKIVMVYDVDFEEYPDNGTYSELTEKTIECLKHVETSEMRLYEWFTTSDESYEEMRDF